MDAARDAGVYLASVHNWLFFPNAAELRRIVVSGELGDIRAAFVTVMGLAPFPATASFRPDWRNDHTVSGGGVLMDFVHAIYLAATLLDARTRRVNAVVSNSMPDSTVEDFAALQLETDRGVGMIHLALGEGSTGFEILGSKGGSRAGFDLGETGRTSWVDVSTAAGTRRIDAVRSPRARIVTSSQSLSGARSWIVATPAVKSRTPSMTRCWRASRSSGLREPPRPSNIRR